MQKSAKILALGMIMYNKRNLKQREFIEFEKFHLPFSGKLSADNPWVVKATMIPWNDLENEYAKLFSQKMGAPGIAFRIAFGALLIQSTLGLTDEMTVQQIRENPYLQYFLGFHEYSYDIPFDPSMMTHFRKRISKEMLETINDRIAGVQNNDDDKNDPNGDASSSDKNDKDDSENNGKLIIDATCIPADIRFPTDISLLNEAREKTEKIIDVLFEDVKGQMKKPRTYRRIARKAFLQAIKSRKKTARERRKHTGKQLRFVERNLKHIAGLLSCEGVMLTKLSRKQYRDLLVIGELYRQQKEMFEMKKNHIPGRIVSIGQPHIRPIVRGKPSAMTEFGAKISLSVVNGYTFADNINWDNFNEGLDLPDQVEKYRNRFGYYPVSVHADKKYQTRKNRDYCDKRGIRISWKKLGRPHQDKDLNKKHRRQLLDDLVYRIRIEGRIGVIKRKYGMNRVMAKLEQTAKTMILLRIIAMNMDRKLKSLFFAIMFWWLNPPKKPLFQ